MRLISINGHLQVGNSQKLEAEVLDVRPVQGFIVVEISQCQIFYNQDGREVFRVERESKQGFWKRFLSWVRLR